MQIRTSRFSALVGRPACSLHLFFLYQKFSSTGTTLVEATGLFGATCGGACVMNGVGSSPVEFVVERGDDQTPFEQTLQNATFLEEAKRDVEGDDGFASHLASLSLTIYQKNDAFGTQQPQGQLSATTSGQQKLQVATSPSSSAAATSSATYVPITTTAGSCTMMLAVPLVQEPVKPEDVADFSEQELVLDSVLLTTLTLRSGELDVATLQDSHPSGRHFVRKTAPPVFLEETSTLEVTGGEDTGDGESTITILGESRGPQSAAGQVVKYSAIATSTQQSPQQEMSDEVLQEPQLDEEPQMMKSEDGKAQDHLQDFSTSPLTAPQEGQTAAALFDAKTFEEVRERLEGTSKTALTRGGRRESRGTKRAKQLRKTTKASKREEGFISDEKNGPVVIFSSETGRPLTAPGNGTTVSTDKMDTTEPQSLYFLGLSQNTSGVKQPQQAVALYAALTTTQHQSPTIKNTKLTAAPSTANRKKQAGFWRKWASPFLDGFCRENVRSIGIHTKENCYSPKRCSDPRIRQACMGQGFVAPPSDFFMLFRTGNGCRKGTVRERRLAEIEGKNGSVALSVQERVTQACIPLRHYCHQQTDGISCSEMDGCEWVTDEPPEPEEPRLKLFDTHDSETNVWLPDIKCAEGDGYTDRVAKRLPCHLKKPEPLRKDTYLYKFLTSTLGRLFTSPTQRHRMLTHQDLVYNVPRNDCLRCKETSTRCMEDSECCSGKCGNGYKHVSCLFAKCRCEHAP
ncbi:unnamed protein product [Amoebophrya sp. A25]|nr:unnamed protein product [Amoebophrya sp. A25]|eukprot:GSA25T00015727001.1